MRALFRFCILPCFFVLNACTSTVELIHKYDNPYVYDPATAVIIVGGIGDTPIGSLTAQTTEDIKRYQVPEQDLSIINAYAWPIPVGESFSLLRADLPQWGKTITFNNAHSLLIEKQGIYYYGTILSKDKQAFLIKKPLPELIQAAVKTYPYVFNELPTINFQE